MQTNADGLQDGTGQSVDLREVAELVDGAGGPGCDIRILTGSGERCLGLLQELADELWCDVYVPPAGATVIERAGDFVAVDAVAGEPVDWLLVRPGAVSVQMPVWFDRSHGRVLLSKGLVTLPLADGLAFATRNTFVAMAAFAGDLALGTEGLTPIAAVVHSGRFAIAWYEGPEERLGGEEFGRLVAASLDAPSFDVQLAIAWPADPAEREQLEYELFAMADVLDRTVWVPEPGCSATTARTESGHIELVAADAEGGPARWHPYASSAATGHYLHHESEATGRLVLRSEAAAAINPRTANGDGGLDIAAEWARLEPDHLDTLRAADLAFRVMRFDQPSEAAALLRVSEAWSEYFPAYENLISRHGGAIGGVADLDRVVDLRQQLDLLVGGYTPRDEVAGVPEVADDRSPAAGQLTGPDQTWSAARTPDMIVGARGRSPHNIAWLPAVPLTNADPLDLYVWTTIPPEHVPRHGLPVADVFLLAHLDGERLAARQRSGFVLRLSVPHGTAVDPSAYTTRLPARLQHRVREAPDIYLVPLVWLSAVTITDCYQLDGDGGCAAAWSLDGAALTVCFKGADHGVPGLPSEVVRWPARRDTVDAYVTLPDDPDWIRARLSTYPGWLPLNRRRPNVAPGYRLLEVAVGRRCGIDLPESMTGLAGVPVAGVTLSSFSGVDVVLPAREFAKTPITRVYATGPRARAVSSHALLGRPLAAALPDVAPPG
jgi:hypothetical protein